MYRHDFLLRIAYARESGSVGYKLSYHFELKLIQSATKRTRPD